IATDLDRRELGWGPRARDLHIDRHADAELDGPTRGASTLLLGPKLRVSRDVQRGVQDLGVVAAVVGRTYRRRVGELVGADQVSTPRLDGVHTDLRGIQVHGPLYRCRRLRPTRAPVGGHRSRVGDD